MGASTPHLLVPRRGPMTTDPGTTKGTPEPLKWPPLPRPSPAHRPAHRPAYRPACLPGGYRVDRETGLAAVEGWVWRQPPRGAARKRVGGSVAPRRPHAPMVFTAQGDMGPTAGDCRRRPDARCCGRPAGETPKGQVVAPAEASSSSSRGFRSRLTVAGPVVLVSFSFFSPSPVPAPVPTLVSFPFLPFISSCACLYFSFCTFVTIH